MTQITDRRRGYTAASHLWAYLRGELAAESRPAERGELLLAMAGCSAALAHTDPDGSDVEGHWWAARLLRVLADVEEFVAYGGVWACDPSFGPAVVEVASRMAATSNLRERHAMLAAFCAAVPPVVGGAAGVVVRIPAPGCPPQRPYVPLADPVPAAV